MDRLKFYIESSIIPLTEVRPVVSGEFEFTKERSKLYYKHEISDALRFDKKADWLLLQPQIADECGEVTVTVEKLCRGVYSQYWKGVFTIFDTTINYDKCFIEVKPDPLDEYKCFEDGIKEEQNTFSSGGNVTVTSLAGTISQQICSDFFNTNASCSDYYAAISNPLDDCLTDPSKWCLKSNVVLINGEDPGFACSATGSDNVLEQTTTWWREVVTDVPCDNGTPVPPAFGSGWQLLTDDCVGSGTASWWRCPSSSNGQVTGDYTRGRTFGGFIDRILNNLNCGLVVKSDFFNLNAVGDAPTNAAYDYAAANLHNLTVHQQSDIKRKNAINGSSSNVWNLKAKDFFDDLQKIFNVWYDIKDGVLILEHYSFFSSNLGWDLTAENTPRTVDYSGNENVKSERFYWKDEKASFSFKSQPIKYDCGEEEKEERCKLFNTDIAFIENPENSEKVNDEGFVLIANGQYQGDLVIIDNNEPLKWTNLQPALHPYARLYKSGRINGVQQDFISWLPYIKQDKFKTDYCCNEQFNPQDLITTNLGNGVVQAASHNALTDRIEIELSY